MVVVKAEQERQAFDRYQIALSLAQDSLEGQLENAIVGRAELIVTEHLRPALRELVAQVEKAAATIKPYGVAHSGLLMAPPEARKARGRLDELATRYSAIRNAQPALGRYMPPAQFDDGRFANFRNFDTLVPGWRQGAPYPWPGDDPVSMLVWLVDHGADFWVQLPAERDARFLEAYPDADKFRRSSKPVAEVAA